MNLTKKVKKTFPEDTLLRRYLIGEIESHDAPDRKGTRRGDQIGLTLPMFASAVLHGTTNMPLNEIADLTGANYGSLRHTVREKRFIEVRDWAHGGLAVSVAQYLLGKIKELEKATHEGKDFHDEIAATPPIFNDAHLYRDSLLPQLCGIYFRHFTSAGSLLTCPRELFARVIRIVFNHIDFAGRIAERAFLDRVNEFLRLSKVQFLSGEPHPHIVDLTLLYLDGESKYHQGETG